MAGRFRDPPEMKKSRCSLRCRGFLTGGGSTGALATGSLSCGFANRLACALARCFLTSGFLASSLLASRLLASYFTSRFTGGFPHCLASAALCSSRGFLAGSFDCHYVWSHPFSGRGTTRVVAYLIQYYVRRCKF